MSIIVNDRKVETGDQLVLHTAGLFTGGHGGINRFFLYHHGASENDSFPVTSTGVDFAMVKLPDNHSLKVYQGDVDAIVRNKSS